MPVKYSAQIYKSCRWRSAAATARPPRGSGRRRCCAAGRARVAAGVCWRSPALHGVPTTTLRNPTSALVAVPGLVVGTRAPVVSRDGALARQGAGARPSFHSAAARGKHLAPSGGPGRSRPGAVIALAGLLPATPTETASARTVDADDYDYWDDAEPPEDWDPPDDEAAEDDRGWWRGRWPLESNAPTQSSGYPLPPAEHELARIIERQVRYANDEAMKEGQPPLFLSRVPRDELEARGVYHLLLEQAWRHAKGSGCHDTVGAFESLWHEPRMNWDSALHGDSPAWQRLFEVLRGKEHITGALRVTIKPSAIIGDLVRAARQVRALVDPPDRMTRRLAEPTDVEMEGLRRGTPEWETTGRAIRHVAAYKAAQRVWSRVRPDPREPKLGSSRSRRPQPPMPRRRACGQRPRGRHHRTRRVHRRIGSRARAPDDDSGGEPEPPGVARGSDHSQLARGAEALHIPRSPKQQRRERRPLLTRCAEVANIVGAIAGVILLVLALAPGLLGSAASPSTSFTCPPTTLICAENVITTTRTEATPGPRPRTSPPSPRRAIAIPSPRRCLAARPARTRRHPGRGESGFAPKRNATKYRARTRCD
jgi:hypothetical protein